MVLGALAVRHEAASAALVRNSIAEDLAARAVSADSIADVVLVASELVGNAVVHTGAERADELAIAWDVEPDAVVVRVADRSDTPPRLRRSDDRLTGGRGLAIVAALSTDWGVLQSPSGKQVWARVPVSA